MNVLMVFASLTDAKGLRYDWLGNMRDLFGLYAEGERSARTAKYIHSDFVLLESNVNLPVQAKRQIYNVIERA